MLLTVEAKSPPSYQVACSRPQPTDILYWSLENSLWEWLVLVMFLLNEADFQEARFQNLEACICYCLYHCVYIC